MFAHDTDTEEHHLGLSAAIFAIRSRISPVSPHFSLHGSSPRLFWSSPPPICSWGPAHSYSWNGCRWHSVDMPNISPSSFLLTSNKICCIPVRSCRSALDILFGQKMCIILLRHLFWNSSYLIYCTLYCYTDLQEASLARLDGIY